MGCSGCGVRKINGLPAGCRNNGACSTGGCGSKLDVYDWLSNVFYQDEVVRHPVVEVKFKGTRKEYYRNSYNIGLEIGDAVAVESLTNGWDVGYVSLTGELVNVQMKKNRIDEDLLRKVLRRANEMDMEKYEEGKSLEKETMIRARHIATNLGLSMKISDVEYQGDRSKATFFYTAEGRVDFRELIKLLAREFKLKVEMRQIGLRQEAGRLGGIGSCGRELCCSTWLTDFHSVPTTAARYQNLFLNPLKLSGQCGRLKCCLNYELDVYVEALNDFPEDNTVIRTEKGVARVEKLDILKRVMWFRYVDDQSNRLYPIEVEMVKNLIDLNEQGISPTDLEEHMVEEEVTEPVLDFKDTVGEERLDRFDQRKKSKKKRSGGREGQPRQQPQASQARGPQGQQPQQNRPQGPDQKGQGQPPRQERGAQQGNKPQPRQNEGRQGEGREGGRPQDKGPRSNQPRRDNQQNRGPRPNNNNNSNRGPRNPRQGDSNTDNPPGNQA